MIYLKSRVLDDPKFLLSNLNTFIGLLVLVYSVFLVS